MNPHYVSGKFAQAVYALATGDGSVQERVCEAMERLNGVSVDALSEEDQEAWQYLNNLIPSLEAARGAERAQAKKAAEIIYQLFEHIA